MMKNNGATFNEEDMITYFCGISSYILENDTIINQKYYTILLHKLLNEIKQKTEEMLNDRGH